jgi:GNAT superfamily N-acetyltransferase
MCYNLELSRHDLGVMSPTSTSFRLRPATQADLYEMTEVLASAFGDDYSFQQMFGCPNLLPGARQHWLSSFASSLEDPYGNLVIVETIAPNASPKVSSSDTSDAANDDPAYLIIAFAKWTAPGAPHRAPPPLSALPSDGDPELIATIYGSISEGRRELMGDRPHWYLNTLGVHKDWQYKGAGSMILSWGIERADAEGIEAFLAAKHAGRRLYERCGFRSERVVFVHDGRDSHALMRRPVAIKTSTGTHTSM